MRKTLFLIVLVIVGLWIVTESYSYAGSYYFHSRYNLGAPYYDGVVVVKEKYHYHKPPRHCRCCDCYCFPPPCRKCYYYEERRYYPRTYVPYNGWSINFGFGGRW